MIGAGDLRYSSVLAFDFCDLFLWHIYYYFYLVIILKGTAEVVFARREDAFAAVKRYNTVQLDGKPMKIEVIGTNIVTPAAGPPVVNGGLGNSNGIPRR